jgi:hypothetical protein
MYLGFTPENLLLKPNWWGANVRVSTDASTWKCEQSGDSTSDVWSCIEDCIVSVYIILHHHIKSSPFWAIAFLRKFCWICLFRRELNHFVGFRNNIFFYRARSSALRPTPKLEDQVSVFMSSSDSTAQLYPPGTGFTSCHFLRLAGLRWRYSNTPPLWSILLVKLSLCLTN